MSGLGKWLIKATEDFERSLNNLLKSHYRKDQKGKSEFGLLLKTLIEQLRTTTFPKTSLLEARQEKAPSKSLKPGQLLAKLYFRLPRLKGSAGEGRIIYLIDTERKEIKLLYIYTHKDYSGRPPDKFLRDLMKQNSKEISDEQG